MNLMLKRLFNLGYLLFFFCYNLEYFCSTFYPYFFYILIF